MFLEKIGGFKYLNLCLQPFSPPFSLPRFTLTGIYGINAIKQSMSTILANWCFMYGQNLISSLGHLSEYFDKLTYSEFRWSYEQHL